MRALLLLLFLAASCGGRTPVPARGDMTAEECIELGGTVLYSIGGGEITCPEGQEEVGVVESEEPAICCRR